MKTADIYKQICGPRFLFFTTLIVLAVPCTALLFTEPLPLISRICGIILPVSFYWLMLSLSRNTGRTIWLMFFFIFLSAFQIVLLYLFGNGPIGVDMFLNIVTTNGGEAFELLGNLTPAIIMVILLYIPVLVAATVAIRRGIRQNRAFINRQRRMALIIFATSILFATTCRMTTGTLNVKTDIFPVNACYNMYLAASRYYATSHYDESSAKFSFGAKDTHGECGKEIYVLVIGETARACNFGIYGYDRDTTPLLSKTKGLTVFKDAITQSNTTHKSVPMLLSEASADNYNCIYKIKSVITAFKEAGFHTVFLSDQKRNHSFIDFFGSEANDCIFLSDNRTVNDEELTGYFRQAINGDKRKTLVVVHTYGSHFTYNERYSAKDSYFTPDKDMSADKENRESLINAYDNTIRNTDKVLSSFISALENTDAVSALIYTSDHGEDIFDDGKSFLHASPIPSYYQLHVPLIVWTSPEYATHFPEVLSALGGNSKRPVATSKSVFHSMLGMAGISTIHRNDSLSFAAGTYTPYVRHYLTDHNKPCALDKLGMTENDVRMFRKMGVTFP